MKDPRKKGMEFDLFCPCCNTVLKSHILGKVDLSWIQNWRSNALKSLGRVVISTSGLPHRNTSRALTFVVDRSSSSLTSDVDISTSGTDYL